MSKEEVIGYKKELNESAKYINKLTKQLNHCIHCITERQKLISVTTLLVLEDTIWCLIGCRKNKMETKHIDEYVWCKQNIFLKKLNGNENKFENEIITNLENKWKAIQRKSDIAINVLLYIKIVLGKHCEFVVQKLQKTQREDNLKQYKVIYLLI